MVLGALIGTLVLHSVTVGLSAGLCLSMAVGSAVKKK